MKTFLGIGAAIFLILAALGVIGVVMFFSYSNQEISLRNSISAQQEVNEAIFDEVWKVIAQQAEITDKYKKDFKEVFVGIMDGRYSSDKKLGNGWKWVWEANPNFNNAMYDRLMTTIESKRAQFTAAQTILRNLKMQHDNLLDLFPSSYFLTTVSDRQKIDVDIITSTRTKNSFKSKKDDDIKLF